MKIATWNLQRPTASARRKRVVKWIDDIAADIWVLTETHDAVIPSGCCGHASTTGADREVEPGERWVTIWSRWALEPLAPTSDPVRAVVARVVPDSGMPMIIYGTVLPWLGSPWRGVAASDGAAFNAALEAQVHDWKSLRASYPDHDLVVSGDFNQDLSDPHYYGSAKNRRILLGALEDASLIAATAGSADPVRRSTGERACIDHICISRHASRTAKALRCWPEAPRPSRELSDHFGIVAEFEPANIGLQPSTAERL